MKLLFVSLKEEGSKRNELPCDSYNFRDFKILALFFSDLKEAGANIEKAFEEYQKLKSGEFPW